MDILDKARAELAANYAGNGPPAAISPDLITLLLGIAINLVQSCFASGGSPIDMVNRRPLLARLRVRAAVSQALTNEYGFGGFQRHGGQRIVETLMVSASKATPEEIEQLSQVEV